MKVSIWPGNLGIVEIEIESGNDVDLAHDLILTFIDPVVEPILE